MSRTKSPFTEGPGKSGAGKRGGEVCPEDAPSGGDHRRGATASHAFSPLSGVGGYQLHDPFWVSRCSNKANRNYIITFTINFTIHFGPHAAEIEPIVKLIVNTKRTNIFLFILAINFTIRSISAAVGPKWVVKLTVKLIL